MKMGKTTKIFNGKTFRYGVSRSRKLDAERQANIFRKNGYYARVVKKNVGWNNIYHVYIRRK